MNPEGNLLRICLLGMTLLLSTEIQAQFTFTTNNGAIAITGYTGDSGAVSIPGTINELPVTSIAAFAFLNRFNITNVTIPDSVTNIEGYAFFGCASLSDIRMSDLVSGIGDHAFSGCNLTRILIPNRVTSIGNWAFGDCSNLTGVFFSGNAPSSLGSHIFHLYPQYQNYPVTAYYRPGTTGWDLFAMLTGVPIAFWLPQATSVSAHFGDKANEFGFNIQWASGQTVVVEACTNFLNPDWQPLQTNTLTTGSAYLSDPQWTNFPSRFYRLRSPW